MDCCPVCHSFKISKKWTPTRIRGKKSILWCGDCGFGWQHPLPSSNEIRDYYERNTPYNIHGENEKEQSSLKRIQRINQLKPERGRLLDVGSGLGYFLKEAKKDGWDVVGLEPQKSAALYCQDQFEIKVHTGHIQNLKLESFDVVTLWDVWEHVHDPLVFLDQCLKLITPGGLLVVAIPNASGWPARIFRGQWRYVMKTHLNYFTLSFVNRIVAEKGLIIKRTDHTVKVQSLLQGFASWLPIKLDTEKIIRLGRKNSIEEGRPEQNRKKSSLDALPVFSKLLSTARMAALKINLYPLNRPYGDLMDLYFMKK